MLKGKGSTGKFHFTRWGIIALVVVVALASIGVTYAGKKGPKPPKDDPVPTVYCSDPFTWVATNDDGQLDSRDMYDPIDPGDDGSVGDYDYWGVGDTSSSDDPGAYPPPADPPAPGDDFPRYTKDVARTLAEIDGADNEFITVTIENAYPYYYPTVFYTLACPESRQGWVRDIVLEPVVDNSEPDPLNYITVTPTLLEVNQQIPSGGEVMGALHVLVNQNARQNATYKFRLTIYTECKIRTCGTAYAYGNSYATCFIGITELPKNKAWGWTNGPLSPDSTYTFPMYAGAAKCDTSKGRLAGTVTIEYDESKCEVTVTYSMNPGYTMDVTHLYVGSERLPRDEKGDYTVSPGQYPYAHDLDYETSDTYTITGLSGNIYVVAHAVACWFE